MKILALGLVLLLTGCAIDYKPIEEVLVEDRITQLEKEVERLKKFQKAIDLQTVYVNYNVEATACIMGERICSIHAALSRVSNDRCQGIAAECLNSAMYKRKKLENYKEYTHGQQTE